MMMLKRHPFMSAWLGSILLYIFLTTISFTFQIYRIFPAYGLFGYTVVILVLLYSISLAEDRWHYILSGLTLVFAGVLASVDIILSRGIIVEELRQIETEWARQLFESDDTVNNLVNVLIILLNIFTSSLSADVLFHGLNKRNFQSDE